MNNYKKMRGKTVQKIQLLIIVFFILTSYPFGFRSLLSISRQTLFVVQGLCLGLLILTASRSLLFYISNTKRGRFFAFFLIIYSIIRAIGGGRCFNSYLEQLLYILFFCVSVVLVQQSKYLYHKLLIIWRRLGALVSLSIIFASVFFIFIRGLYQIIEVDDYTMFFNPLVGFIYSERLRPCWYFYEPSYCGLFLALFFISGLGSKSKYKKIILLLTIVAILIDASVGTILGMVVIIPMALLSKWVSQKKVAVMIYTIITFLLIALQSFDYEKFEAKYLGDIKTSFIDRQERMMNTASYMQKMSVFDIFIGSGVDAIAYEYDQGESNGYYKLLCEYGLIYLIIYLLGIIYMTRKNLLVQVCYIISLISLIIFHTPIVLLSLYLASRCDDHTALTTKSQ